jgi:hypothetical protein
MSMAEHPTRVGMTRALDYYAGVTQPQPYGEDDASYMRAGMFLSGPGLVEDWGCGTTYARRYIGAPYRGIDGVPSKFNDAQVDLATYRSKTPKALMRHVLEHNWDWRDVLENFLSSFTDRAVLILFLPPSLNGTDMNVSGLDLSEHSVWPGLRICSQDLDRIIDAHQEINVHSEEMVTNTPPFNYERIYFFTKIDATRAASREYWEQYLP